MKLRKIGTMNKRGIAVIFIFMIIFLVIIGIYLVMFLAPPLLFPKITKVRTIITYFLVIILWLVLQALVIYTYFRIGLLAVKGFNLYKTKVGVLAFKTQQFFNFK